MKDYLYSVDSFAVVTTGNRYKADTQTNKPNELME